RPGRRPGRTVAAVRPSRYGLRLPQRALAAVSSRTDTVVKLIFHPPDCRAHPQQLPGIDEPTMRAVVRQAVSDVRTAPPPQPVSPSADPALTELRRVSSTVSPSTPTNSGS
ncbi:hypothetical protein, partial [Streptomyces sp. NPDC052179]|uniref:hypothetical protein n=1 Tax=Streptomyces sp. NPDC052179 TaxID=3155680 RepID=UPI0034499BB7